jgi:hypothetical protein
MAWGGSRTSCWATKVSSKDWVVIHSVCVSVISDSRNTMNNVQCQCRAKVFESLDFTVQSLSEDTEQALHPPSIDPATPDGKRSRAKLLRAWVEISAWLSLYNKSKPSMWLTSCISLFLNPRRGNGWVYSPGHPRKCAECN